MALAANLPCPDYVNHVANNQMWLRMLSCIDPWQTVNFPFLVSYVPQQLSIDMDWSLTISETRSLTNTYIGVSGNDIIIICSGTSGLQAPNLISSWTNRDSRPNGGIGYGYDAASFILTQIVNSGRSINNKRWWLVGHSLGGLQVINIAAKIMAGMSPQSVNCWTYGSPRPGNSDLASALSGASVYRWMNSDDPVPLIPGHTSEWPIMAALLPHAVSLFCNAQVQPMAGTLVQPNGSTSTALNGTVPLRITEPSLLSWLTGSSAFGSQAHSIGQFQDRLTNITQPCGLPVGPDRSAFTPEPTQDYSVRLIGTVAAQAIESLPAGGVTGGLPQMIPAKTEDRYTIRRHRPGYAVWYQGNMVSLVRTRREARLIAHQGNSLNDAQAQLTTAG